MHNKLNFKANINVFDGTKHVVHVNKNKDAPPKKQSPKAKSKSPKKGAAAAGAHKVEKFAVKGVVKFQLETRTDQEISLNMQITPNAPAEEEDADDDDGNAADGPSTSGSASNNKSSHSQQKKDRDGPTTSSKSKHQSSHSQ